MILWLTMVQVMLDCQRFDHELIPSPRYTRRGWIGVGLDGTLAESEQNGDPRHIGPPVLQMLKRVNYWVKTGRTVKIFTARAGDAEDVALIQQWCVRYGLPELEVTDRKDFGLIALWDNLAVGVVSNLGVPILPAPMTLWQSLRLRFNILLRGRPVMKVNHEQLQGQLPLARHAARGFFDDHG